ncbi:DMT family transporter [Vibrio hepatarius]|uniref:DMT family transporter n=1 Tax=Vibrio hepatarius TaxID=171383 RepID=UPI00373562CC
MSIQLYPFLFMLASTFSLSLTGLLSKFLSQYVDLATLGFLRFVIPAAIILVINRQSMMMPRGRLARTIWLRAICIAGCQLCFIYSLLHLSLVESIVLFGTGPLFIPVLERLIYKTPLQWLSIASLVATFYGVTLLAGDVSDISVRPELLVGLASGLLNAGSQLSLYRISKSSLSALEINYWTFLFAGLVLLPFIGHSYVSLDSLVDVSVVRWEGLVALLVVVSVLIINTQVFRAKAYRLAYSGTQLAPLVFTNVLFTALWQQIYFDVSYTVTQSVGLLLILAANMFVVLFPIYRRRYNAKAA